MQKADFFRKKCKFAWIVKGLKLKQIFWNFLQQLNTQHTFHPLTPNTIKAFKSCAQKPFLVCRKKHPPPPPCSQNWVWEMFFIILHYKYPQNYIFQKLDTNSCFVKIRAFSNLFSFFYTPCIWLLIYGSHYTHMTLMSKLQSPLLTRSWNNITISA